MLLLLVGGRGQLLVLVHRSPRGAATIDELLFPIGGLDAVDLLLVPLRRRSTAAGARQQRPLRLPNSLLTAIRRRWRGRPPLATMSVLRYGST